MFLPINLYLLRGRCLQNMIQYENKFRITNCTDGKMLDDRNDDRTVFDVFEMERLRKKHPAGGDDERICNTLFFIPDF